MAVICIDFDGTVVNHEFPKTGMDIGAAPVLKELIANGHKLILWTMRSFGNHIEDAVEWFNIVCKRNLRFFRGVR